MMFDEKAAPQEDVIDQTLIKLIDEIIGEEGDEEDFDGASDVVFSVIEELVDAGEMTEVPEPEDSDEVKQTWMETQLPILLEALKMALKGLRGEPEDGDTQIPI